MAAVPPTPTTGQPHDAEIRLHLLGGFRLTHGDTPVVVPRGLQRIIALIGLRPGATRTHLAGLLWPEVTEERALSSLRTALWRLRQDPYCPLTTAADTVRLDPLVRVDVDLLIDTAGRVRDGHPPDDAAEALAAGRHDLLPGWYDDWVLADRERLRQLRLHMLEQVSGQHLAAGRHGEALEAALEAMAAERCARRRTGWSSASTSPRATPSRRYTPTTSTGTCCCGNCDWSRRRP